MFILDSREIFHCLIHVTKRSDSCLTQEVDGLEEIKCIPLKKKAYVTKNTWIGLSRMDEENKSWEHAKHWSKLTVGKGIFKSNSPTDELGYFNKTS